MKERKRGHVEFQKRRKMKEKKKEVKKWFHS